MPDKQILLARQPIYDESLNVVAYELLYRSLSPDASMVDDGDQASSQVLINAFGNFGISNVSEGKPAFINFTPHLIINPPPLDPELLVIEVLEDVQVTPQILEGLATLHTRGFRIALDDFQHHPSLVPLVELADIVKLDVLELGEERLRAEVRQLRNYPLRLLAEKIETWEMFNHCVDLGFSYFQGYFLARPELIRGRQMSVARHAVLQLLSQLAAENISSQALARTVAADPVLGISLLRLVNSAMYRRAKPVESLQDAITYLGIGRMRAWSTLLVLSRIDDKPRELVRMAMVRARFCELLTQERGGDVASRYFMLGMLSTLDAFIDRKLPDALADMPLSAEIIEALLRRAGPMGTLLDAVLAFESARWEDIPWQALAAIGIDQARLEHEYLESLRWAGETLQAMRA